MKQLVIDDKPPMSLKEIEDYFAALKQEQPIEVFLPIENAPKDHNNFIKGYYLVAEAYGDTSRWISVHDTYRIAEHYYPNLSFGSFLAVYKNAFNNGDLVGHTCSWIKRRVLRINCLDWQLDCTEANDEFGHTLETLFNLI